MSWIDELAVLVLSCDCGRFGREREPLEYGG